MVTFVTVMNDIRLEWQ